ncbi:MAG TPA: methyltransferase domain-containing protein [Thermoanaerobaculia bacterium]
MGEAADRSGNDLTLERLYAHRFSAAERAESDRLWSVLCQSYLARLVPSDATVVDVGAGNCGFIRHIRAARRIAIDLDSGVRERAGEGVETYVAEIGALPDLLGACSVDIAFASNIFEHLPSGAELLRCLIAIRTVLRPGGRLIILQPNVRLVGARFWDFFDHTLPLTELGMQEALAAAGFRTISCKAGFLPYTTKTSMPKPAWLLRLYLALPPAQWLFGKQMLIVATPE